MKIDQEKIRVGISECLLGEKVRYDGGHKKNDYVVNTLSNFFEWVPVCPEMDIGMGVPREPVRLLGDIHRPRFVTSRANIDLSDKMYAYVRQKVRELQKRGLCGYILKKDSPSCGMERVRVTNASGQSARPGVGIFARHLMNGMPLLPVEEEGRLNDPRLRENFIARVFCYFRWRQMLAERFTLNKLIHFHSRHRFLLMAHSEMHLRDLDKLVAEAKQHDAQTVKQAYAALFFGGLRRLATARKHTQILLRLVGFFKKQLAERDQCELLQTIEDYRRGLLPLIVPVTLVRHYVNKFEVEFLQEQIYLNPHPKERMLLNHV